MASEQVERLIDLLRGVLGSQLLGVALYGSAVEGGLRAASDLDLFAVTARRTPASQRRALIAGLRPLSARGTRPATWRPVELTVVALSDIVPWRHPPRLDFQSGEWLRGQFDAGKERPWRSPNQDLAIVIAQVRQSSRALLGPPASDLLPDVPREDLVKAMTDEIGSLLADLETDTANVLLTLARIWYTLATATFAPKDVAADWALARLNDRAEALELARDAYLGVARGRRHERDAWRDQLPEARAAARLLVGRIERLRTDTYNRCR